MTTDPEQLVERYEDGAIRRVVDLVDGQPHGIEIGWYVNGRVVEISEWDAGIRHGLAVAWDELGNKISSERFHYGIPTGEADYHFPGENEARTYDFGRLPDAILRMAVEERLDPVEIRSRLRDQVTAAIPDLPTTEWFLKKVTVERIAAFIDRKTRNSTGRS